MYNGVGLQTPRGSGTNGYIQRSMAFLRPKRTDADQDEILFKKKSSTLNVRKADAVLLDHDRKRKIEVEVLEYEDSLRDAGKDENEIKRCCQELRERLAQGSQKNVSSVTTGLKKSNDRIAIDVEKMDSHQLAALKEKEMDQLAAAFSISRSHHKVGVAFDFEAQGQAKMIQQEDARNKEEQLEKYVKSMKKQKVQDEKSSKNKNKKHRRKQHSSSSSSDSSSSTSSSSSCQNSVSTESRSSCSRKSMNSSNSGEESSVTNSDSNSPSSVTSSHYSKNQKIKKKERSMDRTDRRVQKEIQPESIRNSNNEDRRIRRNSGVNHLSYEKARSTVTKSSDGGILYLSDRPSTYLNRGDQCKDRPKESYSLERFSRTQNSSVRVIETESNDAKFSTNRSRRVDSPIHHVEKNKVGMPRFVSNHTINGGKEADQSWRKQAERRCRKRRSSSSSMTRDYAGHSTYEQSEKLTHHEIDRSKSKAVTSDIRESLHCDKKQSSSSRQHPQGDFKRHSVQQSSDQMKEHIRNPEKYPSIDDTSNRVRSDKRDREKCRSQDKYERHPKRQLKQHGEMHKSKAKRD
ncbi:cwf21 protein [Cardiosporidium cionae]|uniref:Cwf21 protein n=1 Tax=Cardiosporidium cionae TaxID=476202 RepID=A0ABQ7JA18_9APIC|nr:cwf21 protein [Cardiosporidium cionae]|eukprot:KAF8820769.1 cwf21 protein [Cardiosporidium cionae]